MAAPIRILGLDPGLAHMGWGVIALDGTRLLHIEHGVIATKPALGLGPRLMALHAELSAVIARLAPAAIAVEQAFVAKDPSAALKLGHARAVALLAAAQAGLEIAEYSPNHIKKSVVGAGHAGKAQVQLMVKHLLPGCGVTQADAADALACAIAHAHLSGTRARIVISGNPQPGGAMIGKLTGVVDSIAEDAVILDVGGVGYLVQCPSSTLSRLAAGAHASLMIEMKVSDDAIKLYGFASAEEREWFRLLQTVQNVGARVALSVLSTLSPRDLGRALALSDKAMIGRAPGVGPKLALRIATELKDKAPAMMLRDGGEHVAAIAVPRGPAGDAVAALVKLGYSDGQAAEAVARAANDLGEDAEVAALIREALRGMGR